MQPRGSVGTRDPFSNENFIYNGESLEREYPNEYYDPEFYEAYQLNTADGKNSEILRFSIAGYGDEHLRNTPRHTTSHAPYGSMRKMNHKVGSGVPITEEYEPLPLEIAARSPSIFFKRGSLKSQTSDSAHTSVSESRDKETADFKTQEEISSQIQTKSTTSKPMQRTVKLRRSSAKDVQTEPETTIHITDIQKDSSQRRNSQTQIKISRENGSGPSTIVETEYDEDRGIEEVDESVQTPSSKKAHSKIGPNEFTTSVPKTQLSPLSEDVTVHDQYNRVNEKSDKSIDESEVSKETGDNVIKIIIVPEQDSIDDTMANTETPQKGASVRNKSLSGQDSQKSQEESRCESIQKPEKFKDTTSPPSGCCTIM